MNPRDWIEAAAQASRLRDRAFLASRFAAEVAKLEATDGAARRAAFLRDMLRALVDYHHPQIGALTLPASVKRLIEEEYARIERSLRQAPDDDFDLRVHSLRCDFRIVAFARTPVGVEHIEVGGVPRSLLWKGGVGQCGRLAGLLLRAGGAKPFYVGHLTHGIKPHAFLLAYNEKSQEFWHRNVAECLQMNPHLAFLREGSVVHGAARVCVGPTEGAIRYALACSPERQRLYAAGRYLPTSHAVIWTRGTMMRWAGLT